MKTTNIHSSHTQSVRELWTACDQFSDEVLNFLEQPGEHTIIDQAMLGDVADLIMILNIIEGQIATLREDIYLHLGVEVEEQ